MEGCHEEEGMELFADVKLSTLLYFTLFSWASYPGDGFGCLLLFTLLFFGWLALVGAGGFYYYFYSPFCCFADSIILCHIVLDP